MYFYRTVESKNIFIDIPSGLTTFQFLAKAGIGCRTTAPFGIPSNTTVSYQTLPNDPPSDF